MAFSKVFVFSVSNMRMGLIEGVKSGIVGVMASLALRGETGL